MEHLSESYWTNRYTEKLIVWDIGYPSTPIVCYIDQLENKEINILIPGAGNAYEAIYLFEKGFKNITVCDLSIEPLKKFKNHEVIKTIHGNFFDIEEKNQYDLVIEQTFFCAIDPDFRQQYVDKMSKIIKSGGKLVGLLFASQFIKSGPPYGGDMYEYVKLFENQFKINTIDISNNSIISRDKNELFIIMQKK